LGKSQNPRIVVNIYKIKGKELGVGGERQGGNRNIWKEERMGGMQGGNRNIWKEERMRRMQGGKQKYLKGREDE
jgi:hypothetical protein